MAIAFIGLGSNLGDRGINIRRALDELVANLDVRVKLVSSLYETAPVGYIDQPDFLNAVAQIETDLNPHALLKVMGSIERSMGRERNIIWVPRVIDMDILIYDDEIVDTPDLKIPHPRMAERAFVLAPLAEIAPDISLDGRKVADILEGLAGQRVKRFAEVP